MKFLPLLCVACVCFSVTATKAQNLSGNALHEICTTQNEVSKLACSSYVRGVVEGMYWGVGVSMQRLGVVADNATTAQFNNAQNTLLMVCQPPTVTLPQLVDVAIAYLVNHPESRHQGARTQIWKALSEAFPCN